jgi:hypothetical protein
MLLDVLFGVSCWYARSVDCTYVSIKMTKLVASTYVLRSIFYDKKIVTGTLFILHRPFLS